MIRINLLGAERLRVRKGLTFDVAQRMTLAASVIVVVAVLVVGWWYLSLSRESSELDRQLAAAEQESTRLRSLLAEVQEFERRREILQQRVSLIEQLRRGQSIPVQLLDHVSRSVPEMLWLTTLRQEGDQVTIEGRSTTLISLSDFVGNLGNNPFLQRPIEIVQSQVQPASGAGANAVPELIQFSVRARVNRPAQPQPEAEATGRGGRGAARAGRGGAGRGRQRNAR